MKKTYLRSIIDDPKEAREYIKDFYRKLGREPETGFVDTNERRIDFVNMTDDDAIFVANQFASMRSEAGRRK